MTVEQLLEAASNTAAAVRSGPRGMEMARQSLGYLIQAVKQMAGIEDQPEPEPAAAEGAAAEGESLQLEL